MRILSFSNPIYYTSGYSTQFYLLCKVLQMMGHEIFAIDCSIAANNTQETFRIEELSRLYETQHPEFMPNIRERMDVLSKVTFLKYPYMTFPCDLEASKFNYYIDKYKMDYLLFFIDIWIIKVSPGDRFNCKAVCWLPIHFEPVEERTIQAGALFDTIVPLGHDGRKKLVEIFPEKNIPPRVPHVIDFANYSRDKIDVPAFRKEIGLRPDAFVVLMVANNSEDTGRKGFFNQLEAFQLFSETHPSAQLYMHVRTTGCENIHHILEYLKIPSEKIVFSDQSKMGTCCYTFDFVVKLYKMADVLLNATCSEGYSCPPPEAAALGTPSVITDTTAMPDNLYNGEKAKTYQRKFVYQNVSYWYVPDVKSVAACLGKIYDRSPEEKKEKSRYGMKMIRENYTLKTLYDGWKPVFV